MKMLANLMLLFLAFVAVGANNATVVTTLMPQLTTESVMLYNFTKHFNIRNWSEQSDTIKGYGMSKATLTIQKTDAYQRAIFFALINPQKNGAGFAGVRVLARFNIAMCTKLQIKCRGQGDYYGYKVVLTHRGLNTNMSVTFEQYFRAPIGEFNVVSMAIANFKPYLMGLRINETYTMDKTQVSSLGIQTYGGVHLVQKQKGPVSLEMDWIRCVS